MPVACTEQMAFCLLLFAAGLESCTSYCNTLSNKLDRSVANVSCSAARTPHTESTVWPFTCLLPVRRLPLTTKARCLLPCVRSIPGLSNACALAQGVRDVGTTILWWMRLSGNATSLSSGTGRIRVALRLPFLDAGRRRSCLQGAGDKRCSVRTQVKIRGVSRTYQWALENL